MDQTSVTLINQLTLTTAAIIACVILWRAYIQSHNDHIKDLREFYQSRLYDLQARVMVLEDKAGVERNDRFKYYAPGRPEEKEIALKLDKSPQT